MSYRDRRSCFDRSLRLLLGAVFSLTLCTGCQGGGRAPSIVLILVDTLRADHLGVYGFEGDISPAIDRLAEESIVFENCVSQAPWTKPAVASLFTSLYPDAHQLTNHDGKYWGTQSTQMRTGVLPEQAITLAEQLRDAGYHTAAFVTNPWVTPEYGFAQGFDLYDDEAAGIATPANVPLAGARSWLDSLPADKPFFLYLHFMDVHAPYNAPKADYDAVFDSPDLAPRGALKRMERPDLRWNNIEVRAAWATEAMRHEQAYWRARYASGVRALDRRLAPFLGFLRRSGILDRSVLVLTSDHGEELFEHRGWSHGQTLFDDQLMVPLIVRMPGAANNGRRESHLASLIDLMPTLLALGGAKEAPRAQGSDLSALLQGRELTQKPHAFASATQRQPGLHAVRNLTHKFILDVDSGSSQFFELTADPAEQSPMATAGNKVAKGLERRLARHLLDSVSEGKLQPEAAAVSDELLEKLRALGYVQ